MYTVIGIEKVDYTNKQGKPVLGVKLHCTYEVNKVQGLAVESIYCTSSIDTSDIIIGSIIDVLYNRFGQVARIQLIP